MINIIKHGKKIYTTNCKKCGCEFSYNNEDIIILKYPNSLPGYKKIIKCPDCKNEIILEATR